MRKNQRWLMTFISVIVIVAFVFLYNQTDLEKLGTGSVGTIYGKKVPASEFARNEKQFDIARGLGMIEMLQTLAIGTSRDQTEDYVWNTLVLRKKAEQLQVEPSAEAVTEKIRSLAPFQTDGQFDYTLYQKFVDNALMPRGFSETQLNELIRDDLRLARLRELIGSAYVTPESEVKEAYGNAFRKRQLQIVKLNRETLESAAVVTPEEIKAAYDKNKDAYKTDEKRVVKYVSLELSEAEKKLTGKERIAALQPISEKADVFSQRLLKAGADFEAIAKELAIPVRETAAFASNTPPTEIAAIPQVGPTVFSLTSETPDSDVLQTDDGFFVFHLAKVEAAVPETLEQATPRITSQLKQEKMSAAMTKQAAELQTSLRAGLKVGKTFSEAATAAGLKAEAVPPYVPAELQQSQDFGADRIIQMRAANLSEGAVSDLIPTMDGGALAYLEKLEPLDEAKWQVEKESMLDRYFSSRREMGFSEWFRSQRAAANIRVGASAG